MYFISPHQIKPGRAPDFEMRVGKVVIYHGSTVYFFSQNRKLLHSIVVSNLSLRIVAKSARDIFDANEASTAPEKAIESTATRRLLLKSRNGYILATLRLPKNLKRLDFIKLCEYFRDVVNSHRRL